MIDDGPETPVLRRAIDADARAVAEVWSRSRTASVPMIPPPVHTDDEVRDWFAQVVLPTQEVWVAAAGPVVAMMVLSTAAIDQLYVDPEWQQRGLGSQLVERAKELRPGGLDLWTFQTNRAAQRFYERHGFVAVETTDGANEERAPDIRYRWDPVA